MKSKFKGYGLLITDALITSTGAKLHLPAEEIFIIKYTWVKTASAKTCNNIFLELKRVLKRYLRSARIDLVSLD